MKVAGRPDTIRKQHFDKRKKAIAEYSKNNISKLLCPFDPGDISLIAVNLGHAQALYELLEGEGETT